MNIRSTRNGPAALGGPWELYAPTAEAPWDLRRVVHLHRRAGFAATWDELRRDLKEGPGASIDRLIQGHVRASRTPEELESLSTILADAAVGSNDPNRLKAWWIWRMLHGPDPLGERLTLMWHNHFATSNLKVNNLAAMRQQNETFRRLARAPFGDLLKAAVRDPALLVWLDAPANRKGHPNENLARELMELFTIGIGHYAETDVQEAARALTGWTVADGHFREAAAVHDDGAKCLFGQTGNWSGDDLVAMLLDHPATAERLAMRIVEFLMGEGTVGAEARRELAEGLRAHDLEIAWAIATVLRSRAFFSDSNIQARVVGPPEFVVDALVALEITDPRTLALADWVTRLGQDLFYPPNVGGWAGGRTWLGSKGVIARINFAAALVEGRDIGCPEPPDLLGLAVKHGSGRSPDDLLTWFSRLLRGREPGSDEQGRILSSLKTSPPQDLARRLVALVLASPEAQLA